MVWGIVNLAFFSIPTARPMFSRFFGSKPAATVPSTNQGILSMGDSIEMLQKREAVLDKKIAAEVAAAREATVKGNKPVALSHLKKKKQLEENLLKVKAQMENLETMQARMEEAAINVETMKAQKEGAKAIKETYGKMTPDKIDQTMEEVRAVMDSAQEISSALAQPLASDAVDEDDLMAELAQIEQEELDKQMLGVGGRQAMPAVPSGRIGAPDAKTAAAAAPVVDEDEEALRRLEAELNM